MARGTSDAHQARREAMRRKTQRRHHNFYQRCRHWASVSLDSGSPLRWGRERWVLLAGAALIVTLSVLVLPVWAHAMKRTTTPVNYTHVPLAIPPMSSHAARPVPENWHVVEVQPGQTLSGLFQAQGLGFGDLQRVMDAVKDSDAFHNLHPGDQFAFLTSADGDLEGLRFDADAGHRVTLRFADDKVSRNVHVRATERREHIAHGVIHSSLFGAASRAGLSEAMVVKLADVFKFDIDFIRDIRSGDRFTVVYDDVYRDGAYLHSGNIIAAEFYNRGHRYTAYRFTLPNGNIGYYSQDGRPLQKALLRVPLKFTRISSRFGMRMDPVIHKRHLHAGVDYAAPMGTPIHAAGNGVITVHSWVRGYGRYIRIKNTPSYSTYYGHMSRYAPGLHVGSHVRQGQVIGYVGETGWATGPHLHYGVLLHGKPVNPLTVTLPKPKPLKPKLLARFKQQLQPMLARIDTLDANIRLAAKLDGDKNHAD
jgi:murein DD-endopeptidase MepM/ murein hydrolase activator NlpD